MFVRLWILLIYLIGPVVVNGQSQFSGSKDGHHKSLTMDEVTEEEGDIYSVILRNARDYKLLTKNILKLSKIESIIIYSKAAKHIDNSILPFHELKICLIGFKSNRNAANIVNILSNFRGLEKLALRGLKKIPKGLSLLDAEYLELSNGRFKTIPMEFSKIKSTTVDFSYSKEMEVSSVIRVLSINPSIQNLSLRGCTLHSLNPLLFSMPSLKVLDLSDNLIECIDFGCEQTLSSGVIDIYLYLNPITHINSNFFTCTPVLEFLMISPRKIKNHDATLEFINELSQRNPNINIK